MITLMMVTRDIFQIFTKYFYKIHWEKKDQLSAA